MFAKEDREKDTCWNCWYNIGYNAVFWSTQFQGSTHRMEDKAQ